MSFFRWLNTPKPIVEIVAGGVVSMLLLLIINGLCSMAYYAVVGTALMPDWQGLNAMSEREQFAFFKRQLFSVPLGCFLEELFSRAPLTLVGKLRPRRAMPLLVAIPLSIFFGWMHGGWATVPYHGSGGLIFSLCYLKAGGQEGKFLRPLWTSYLVHLLFDLVLLGVIVATYAATMN